MSKKSTRHKQILDLLVLKERLVVEELAKILDVTPMTVRRDLAEMERKGELVRIHGGCLSISALQHDAPFRKQGNPYSQMHTIAKATVSRIADHETVYLDTDKMAIHLARLLPLNRELRIVTNHLRVAMELFLHKHRGESLEVILLGGELDAKSPNLIGELVPMRLAEYRLDVAIVGADAVDMEQGEFYKNDVEMAALSRAAIARARRTLVLADHTKLGNYAPAVVGRFGPNVTLVTNRTLDPANHELLEATGADLVLAKE